MSSLASSPRTATFTIKSLSPLCWTRYLSEAKRDDEDGRKYEERVWRGKVHVAKTGKGGKDERIAIPSLGLRDSIARGGKDIPIGKGAARAENLLKTSTIPTELYVLTDRDPKDLRCEWRMLPSNPGRNSGTRVPKLLPMLDEWTATGELILHDDRITEELLTLAINTGGIKCGIGALRAEGGGLLGRYQLAKLSIA